MAKLSFSLSAALILLVAMAFVIDTSQAGGEGSVKLQDCPTACDVRCSATSHKSACTFFCNYCCKKCLCVPSGTYGNKDECPCYRDMKTQQGTPKCP